MNDGHNHDDVGNIPTIYRVVTQIYQSLIAWIDFILE